MTTFEWRKRLPVLLVALLATLVVAPTQASAEQEEKKEFEDTIHVIQKKPVLEKNRLEIQPRFGMSVNDSVYRSFKAGANLNFHISERAYIGGLFEWFDFGGALGGKTKAFDAARQLNLAPNAPVVQWFGALEAGFVPIYGKFALFNLSIIYYDFGVSLGVGYANAGSLTVNPSGTFGVTGSIHGRFFLNDWMAFNLELRDLSYPGNAAGPDFGGLANVVTTSAGFSFYFPTSFEYSSEQPDK